jgi:signal transduction histidine kinase
VALIAFAPPLVVAITELRQLRERGMRHAQHVASMLDLYGRMPQASIDGLRRHLATELERDSVAYIEVDDARGQPVVRAGARPPWALPATVELALPANSGPFATIRLTPENEDLRRDLLRIVGIHLMVGLVLGLGIYRIPVRAFARTIQELKSAQNQLVHADRLSALGALYAGLTHEINNPLGILSARVKLLLAGAKDKALDADTVRDLEVIDRQGGRIAEIMRSLLAYARKSEFRMASVDLNAVVREVVSLVNKPFAKQGVLVETELDAGLPGLQASPDRLQQVLLNLLNNARDAMPQGGTITVRTTSENGHVVAEVSDTGPGISSQAKEHLFEPFFTTKEAGKGTGLGLWVSYGIVNAHGGELQAQNAPAGGALFRMLLPLAAGMER